MAKRKLGKVGFNYKGVYDDSVEYEKWDVISFGRGTYLNIVSEGEIIINQNPEDFPNKWKCIAYIGRDGGVDDSDLTSLKTLLENLKSELIEVEDVLAFVLNIQHKKNIEIENIIKEGVISNEEVIAFALNELNNRINNLENK